ncbi:uncharacterized protein B0H18DRAFT_1020742 [Fomitopsis serialis]|uniref:uncharacterized protein n=1 Tax=Fomitopsis serialis TaxID=139415 RepID=UPI0020072807|nr:uncharacterized protein B0H18DRAFT_1020742 [Neoantrodia serialis]KAH9921660.1 hypothetical protein B0H18DRAFT_1020742 [Neoantrodia serialis]
MPGREPYHIICGSLVSLTYSAIHQHFHGRYHSGERFDCNSPHCKTSSAHAHAKGSNCGCSAVETDRNRVQNMFYTKHEDCQGR